jgi:hypothetical protein
MVLVLRLASYSGLQWLLIDFSFLSGFFGFLNKGTLVSSGFSLFTKCIIGFFLDDSIISTYSSCLCIRTYLTISVTIGVAY